MADEAYLDVSGLSRHFDVSDPFVARLLAGGKKRLLTAVDDVSFRIAKGETYALVGESGSGKSTIARMIVGLERPDSGRIGIDGHTVFDETQGQVQDNSLRQKLQMVFQSPYSSLNPRWRVGDILMEPIRAFNLIRIRLRSSGGCANCWIRSDCRHRTRPATRMNFPVANGSGFRLRGRWPRTRNSSSVTSRPRRWMCRFRRRF